MPFQVGQAVQGRFTEDNVWYEAKIDAISNGSYTVTYTEYGNSEVLPAMRIRSPLKVGDAIEGQFTEDDVWYEAKIDAISEDGHNFTVTYTEYGNSETIPYERTRPLVSTSPASLWKVGDIVEGQFTEDDVWYEAKIDAITDGNYSVTYIEYGNSEVIPADRIRAKESSTIASAPAPTVQAVQDPPVSGGEDSWGSSTPSFGGSEGFGGSSSFSQAASSNPATTSLFVGGLSFQTTEDSLREAFTEFGEIDKVRIVKDRDTGKPKGFGYVEFFDVETAEKAMQGAAGKEIDGRTIRLDYSQPKGSGGGGGGGGSRSGGRSGSGGFGGSSSGGFGGSSSGGFGGSSGSSSGASCSLFVGGLSFDTTEESLQEAFAEFGNIEKIRIMKDRETGRSKGFGYIDFFDSETAAKAKEQASGREVDGRPIRLDFSQPKGSKPSSGGGSGSFGGASGGSFGGASGGSFGGSTGGSFGASSSAPAPQITAPIKDVIEPFDPSILNPNRKVKVSSTSSGEVSIVISRNFDEGKKGGKLFSQIH